MKKLLLLLLLSTCATAQDYLCEHHACEGKSSYEGCSSDDPNCSGYPIPDFNSQCKGVSGGGFYAFFSPHWPCGRSMNAFKGKDIISISTLWGGTYGEDLTCLKKYVEDPRFKCFEGHLMNEVGQRNNRAQPYEFLYGLSVSEYKKKLNAHDPKLLKSIKNYTQDYYDKVIRLLAPYTACSVSNSIESNLSTSEGKVVLDIMKPILTPRCSLVWNPNGSGRIDRTIYEKHGKYPAVGGSPCIVNLDGTDISFYGRPSKDPNNNYIKEQDLLGYNKKYKACSVQLWFAECNFLDLGKPWSPPRSRTEYPSRRLFRYLSKYIGKI